MLNSKPFDNNFEILFDFVVRFAGENTNSVDDDIDCYLEGRKNRNTVYIQQQTVANYCKYS